MAAEISTAGTARAKSKHLIETTTTQQQDQTEQECEPFFISIPDLHRVQITDLRRLGLLDPNSESTAIQLIRQKHAAFLTRPLRFKENMMLPSSYMSLDSSKPWILYWTLQGLDLIDRLPTEDETLVGVVKTLESCWTNCSENEEDGGGFGGGYGQLPHCATSFAAVSALCIIAGNDRDLYPEATSLALELLQRKKSHLLSWFITLRYEVDNGDEKACGYRMHHDGEVDVRASYCICVCASLLDVLTPTVTKGMAEYIMLCQTYEGGFGGEPFAEAHGGYTYCSIAALHILAKDRGIDVIKLGMDFKRARGWLSRRQMAFEGGFQGRCNKLVDGCYTFWIGGAIALLDIFDGVSKFDSGVFREGVDSTGIYRQSPSVSETRDENGKLTFHQHLLQRYTLLCGQDVNGGLRDKPSKPRDFYHTCYNLSGLSISQHILTDMNSPVISDDEERNVIRATHPAYNIGLERLQHVIQQTYGNKE